MRAMKDSGIPWLGMIPSDWTVAKVKNFYSFSTGFTPDTKNDDFYDDEGQTWVTISDLKGRFIQSSEKGISKAYIDKYKPLIVPTNSLLYSFKLSVGQVAITTKPLFTNEAIASFRGLDDAEVRFLFYSSQICIIKNANQNIYGANLLNQDLINNADIVYPPLSEQERIADFLDTKCAEIDEMIALQEKTVEELKAYKQSVITEAVTKGLNPDAPMKDSGIPWIGLIPQGWKVGKAKNLCTFLNGYAYNSNDFLKEGKFPVIRIGDIQDGHISYDNIVYVNDSVGLDVYKTHIGDILIAMSGATTGKVGRVLEGEDGYINQRVGIIRSIEQEFVYYLFQTKVFEEYVKLSSIGSAQPNISSKGILNYTIVIPSHDEQQAIASYLDNKCSEIDRLIEIKQQKAEELKTYKKSLIYEYVTGKKEVV